MMNGERYPEAVMATYRRYKGPPITGIPATR
jgi:hypothetical protein